MKSIPATILPLSISWWSFLCRQKSAAIAAGKPRSSKIQLCTLTVSARHFCSTSALLMPCPYLPRVVSRYRSRHVSVGALFGNMHTRYPTRPYTVHLHSSSSPCFLTTAIACSRVTLCHATTSRSIQRLPLPEIPPHIQFRNRYTQQTANIRSHRKPARVPNRPRKSARTQSRISDNHRRLENVNPETDR